MTEPKDEKVHNPKGISNYPREKEDRKIIDSTKYSGPTRKLGEKASLKWDKLNKRYEFIPGSETGRPFTYFAAQAADLKKDYLGEDQVFSQTYLKKQVWYKDTPPTKFDDGIGKQYEGMVPLYLLLSEFNDRINVSKYDKKGNLKEKIDFTKAYKNWSYRWEIGVFYRNEKGELYTILLEQQSKEKKTAGFDPKDYYNKMKELGNED